MYAGALVMRVSRISPLPERTGIEPGAVMSNHTKAPVTLDEVEEETCLTIFRSIMRSHNMLHRIGCEVAAGYGLHIAEINIIDMLGKHGSLSMGDLARTTFVAPSSTTRTVKQLEARGLVTRERSTRSERIVTVSLTRKGKSLFKKTYPTILLAVQKRIQNVLSRSECNTLGKLLQKLES